MQLSFPDRKCVLSDCPYTCPNRNYPFLPATYPFFQERPPFFSISFILNLFSPFVFPLPIT
ncbi:hypothetical protein FR991_15090 [Bacteroides fragilis]|nr:hypothetical protein HR50_020805 [Bacteroides fragilis]RGL01299.1 hypothetical protein DXC86_13300 [Bacteroides fragilis]RHF26167.1 hypothetical protein DW695_13055 [Bacteroides fragilis]THC65039.1 hypothetical protein E7X03_05710 [Bacteroides fragilis]TWV04510.1 hypothetical protein FSA67_16975 [Bacteroides fragilis]